MKHKWAGELSADSCARQGAEFRRHAALLSTLTLTSSEPLPALPPPRAGLRDDGLYDGPTPSAEAEFVKNQLPDVGPDLSTATRQYSLP